MVLRRQSLPCETLLAFRILASLKYEHVCMRSQVWMIIAKILTSFMQTSLACARSSPGLGLDLGRWSRRLGLAIQGFSTRPAAGDLELHQQSVPDRVDRPIAKSTAAWKDQSSCKRAAKSRIPNFRAASQPPRKRIKNEGNARKHETSLLQPS